MKLLPHAAAMAWRVLSSLPGNSDGIRMSAPLLAELFTNFRPADPDTPPSEKASSSART
jgi:hypothetical protein